MKLFKNVNAYIEGKGIVKTSISFDDTIKEISDTANGEIIEIDDGAIVVPAFIDEHSHGAGGSDFLDGTKESLEVISETVAKEGTAYILATTATQTVDFYLNALKNISEFMKNYSYKGTKILGVHLEGIFLCEKFKGAHQLELLRNPDEKLLEEFIKASDNTIKLVTFAPELSGGKEFADSLKKHGIVASIGHSNASFNEVMEAKSWGITNVTHTYNAQRPLHHRDIGIVGAGLLDDELNCELIADTIHVSVPAMKLLVKNKPKDKLVLITDSMRAKGLSDGLSEIGGQKVIVKNGEARLEDGTLAGSVLKLNVAIKNMVEKVGVSFTQAIDYATINPAKALKIDKDYGSIKVGKKASFTVLDKDYNVLMTVCEGNIIYKS